MRRCALTVFCGMRLPLDRRRSSLCSPATRASLGCLARCLGVVVAEVQRGWIAQNAARTHTHTHTHTLTQAHLLIHPRDFIRGNIAEPAMALRVRATNAKSRLPIFRAERH